MTRRDGMQVSFLLRHAPLGVQTSCRPGPKEWHIGGAHAASIPGEKQSFRYPTLPCTCAPESPPWHQLKGIRGAGHRKGLWEAALQHMFSAPAIFRSRDEGLQDAEYTDNFWHQQDTDTNAHYRYRWASSGSCWWSFLTTRISLLSPPFPAPQLMLACSFFPKLIYKMLINY